MISFINKKLFDLFLFIDCRNSTAAAYHVRKGNNGGIGLPLHCETLQNLQRQKIFVHADGVVPGWWAMDNLKVSKVGVVIEKYACIKQMTKIDFSWIFFSFQGSRKFWWWYNKILYWLCGRGIWLFTQQRNYLQGFETRKFVIGCNGLRKACWLRIRKEIDGKLRFYSVSSWMRYQRCFTLHYKLE